MSGGFSVGIRPGLIVRCSFLTFYLGPVIVAGALVVALEVPIVFAIRGEFAGPIPGWAQVLLGLAWLALAIPGWRLVHRINRRFLDRVSLRLTPTSLYLGRHDQTGDRRRATRQ